MKKDAKDYRLVNSAMAGKSNNFTLLSTKLNHVKNKNVSKDLNAHSFTALKIKELLSLSQKRIKKLLPKCLLEKRETYSVLNSQIWQIYFLKTI